jgi:hypothetical protein
MTDEEKKEYDEMMADLKNLGIEPLHTENEEGEEEEILINRFTFGDFILMITLVLSISPKP